MEFLLRKAPLVPFPCAHPRTGSASACWSHAWQLSESSLAGSEGACAPALPGPSKQQARGVERAGGRVGG